MEQFFMYISVVEGVVIAFLLSWEIFWLSRMYKVLWNMPTAKQVQDMVDMIKKDRDAIASAISEMNDMMKVAGQKISLISSSLYSLWFSGGR
jgi:high-affinity Fe2+/Pb2+ permease